jgi:hypothetical protein
VARGRCGDRRYSRRSYRAERQGWPARIQPVRAAIELGPADEVAHGDRKLVADVAGPGSHPAVLVKESAGEQRHTGDALLEASPDEGEETSGAQYQPGHVVRHASAACATVPTESENTTPSRN